MSNNKMEIAHINKILEIDLDTERDFQLRILQVTGVNRKRERQPDGKIDLNDNLCILVNALIATILEAEEKGVYEKGKGMQHAFDLLQEAYVDTSCQVREFKCNEDGSIKKTITSLSQ